MLVLSPCLGAMRAAGAMDMVARFWAARWCDLDLDDRSFDVGACVSLQLLEEACKASRAVAIEAAFAGIMQTMRAYVKALCAQPAFTVRAARALFRYACKWCPTCVFAEAFCAKTSWCSMLMVTKEGSR